MSSPAIPGASTAGLRLHERRCVRHSEREAAARCPRCGEFFCRECVVEHDGKLLCSACLARATQKSDRRRVRLVRLRGALLTGGGAILLWLLFYTVGALLLKIPPDFHDGTIWKKAAQP